MNGRQRRAASWGLFSWEAALPVRPDESAFAVPRGATAVRPEYRRAALWTVR